jgi:peptidoglycan/LPS O-acetylase OafA/YrhL
MPQPAVTGNTELTQPENRAFYPALDGLRAVAFLMVFFGHYMNLPWGWTGVDLFFVLSGFLITGILYDSRNDPHRARTFYIRRTLRIFPLYYGIMLLFVVTRPLLHWQIDWSWLVWPAYLGNYARFVHPYVSYSPLQKLADFQTYGVLHGHHAIFYLGHFWSLCVEEQFYLLWPWLVFWIRGRRALLWVCAATLPLCLLARVLTQSLLQGGGHQWMLDKELLYRATPFRLDALLLGGLIALLLRGPLAGALLRWSRPALVLAGALVLLWAALTPSHGVFNASHPYPDWKFTWGLSVIDLLAALLILAALQPASVVYRVLSLRPLRWLGRISYGAYVLHDVPHILYGNLGFRLVPNHPKGVGTLIALASTLLLAWLSFRYFETPFLNLKSRWAPSHRPASSAVPIL